jgi:hypothetical protein
LRGLIIEELKFVRIKLENEDISSIQGGKKAQASKFSLKKRTY